MQGIVAIGTIEVVIPVAAVQGIVAIGTIEAVLPVAAVQGIVARVTIEGVIPVAAYFRIVTLDTIVIQAAAQGSLQPQFIDRHLHPLQAQINVRDARIIPGTTKNPRIPIFLHHP